MSNKNQEDALSALVGEAEAAVASVKDPELRRVAFEKILETLLEGSSANSRKAQGSKKRRSKKKTVGMSTKKAPATSRKKTAIRKGPKARVAELIDDAFFKKQRTITEVKAELANRGHHIAITSLSGPLQSLTQDRRLRRNKITRGAKSTYAYSNW